LEAVEDLKNADECLGKTIYKIFDEAKKKADKRDEKKLDSHDGQG